MIRLADTGHSVEGYLGPYQIGTQLTLVCQVNGGKEYHKCRERRRIYTPPYAISSNFLLGYMLTYIILIKIVLLLLSHGIYS